LEMFVDDLLSATYDRAAGALEMFVDDLLSATYDRAAGFGDVRR